MLVKYMSRGSERKNVEGVHASFTPADDKKGWLAITLSREVVHKLEFQDKIQLWSDDKDPYVFGIEPCLTGNYTLQNSGGNKRFQLTYYINCSERISTRPVSYKIKDGMVIINIKELFE